MRNEKLFRAIGQIDGDLIEHAAEIKPDKMTPAASSKSGTGWWKYVAVAAGIILMIGVLGMLPEQNHLDVNVVEKDTQKEELATDALVAEKDTQKQDVSTESLVAEDTEKPLMNFAIAFGGMGYEGIMGYEMPKRANPWQETDEIDRLPIFENTSVYHIDSYFNTEWLEQERYEQMEKWLLEVMTFFGMEEYEIERNRRECVARGEAVEITVDGDMHLRIEFVEGLSLPEKYNTTTAATVGETYEVAEYILAEYGALFNMANPQIVIEESDYTFFGERYHHKAYFYEEGENAVENLLNYYFTYAEYSLNDEGKLWFVDIVRGDWNVIGEYEVITLEEAMECLLNGEYDTSYFGDSVPTSEYIRDVELVYYMSMEDDYKPYYKFWVEVPEEKRENGLNTYVAYYVPAIEGAYIKITFN